MEFYPLFIFGGICCLFLVKCIENLSLFRGFIPNGVLIIATCNVFQGKGVFASSIFRDFGTTLYRFSIGLATTFKKYKAMGKGIGGTLYEVF